MAAYDNGELWKQSYSFPSRKSEAILLKDVKTLAKTLAQTLALLRFKFIVFRP